MSEASKALNKAYAAYEQDQTDIEAFARLKAELLDLAKGAIYRVFHHAAGAVAEDMIAAVTLQGHPLRGYRYWRVFSPDHQHGHFVLETGALDEPGPGPLDGIKFLAGQSAQLRIWQEYLQDALHLSSGTEGFDPSYDFPFGVFGFPGRFEVLNEVTGVD